MESFSRRAGPLAAALLIVLVVERPIRADLANGSFESNNLTGWATSSGGLVQVVTSAANAGYTSGGSGPGSFNPTHGNYFARLEAGLGAGVYTLLSQSFAVTVGDVLSFDVYFDAGDYLPYNDDGYARLVGTTSSLGLFSSNVAAVGNYGATYWTGISHTFTTAGTYQIELGVRNVRDNAAVSYLGVDNVRLESAGVPEPATVAAGLVGIAAAVGLGLRRRVRG